MKEESVITERVLKTVQQQLPQEIKEKEDRFNLRHGKITDNCDLITCDVLLDDFMQDKAVIEGKGVTYKLSDIDTILSKTKKAKAGIWIHCQKLLMRIIAEVTDRRCVQLSINIKEFASMCGIDLLKTNAVKDFQKNMSLALEIIFSMELGSFTDRQGKQEKLISLTHAIRKIIPKSRGYLSFIIEQEFLDYILKCPLKKIPVNIYKISGKSPNAFKLAIKLAEYDGNNNNKISVLSLLKETTLQSLLELKEKKTGKWTRQIRDPFNAMIKELIRTNNLSSYKFVTAKGEPRTLEEANAMTAEEWHKLYFVYELA